jgi:hypothetical protein
MGQQFCGYTLSLEALDSCDLKVSGKKVFSYINIYAQAAIIKKFFGNEFKSTYPEVYTPYDSIFTDDPNGYCGAKMYLGGITIPAAGSIIKETHFYITIPMFLFNFALFMRYLPKFYGEWYLDVIKMRKENLVYAQIRPNTPAPDAMGRFGLPLTAPLADKNAFEFNGMDSLFKTNGTITGGNSIYLKFSPQKVHTSEMGFHFVEYMLLDSVKNEIFARYGVENPIRVPISIVDALDLQFTARSGEFNQKFDVSTPNVTSVMLLFNDEHDNRTVGIQPFVKDIHLNSHMGANVYPINSVDVHSYNDFNLERYIRDVYGFNANLSQSFNTETFDSLYPLLSDTYIMDGTNKVLVEAPTLRKASAINNFLYSMPLTDENSLFSGLCPKTGDIKWQVLFNTTPGYSPPIGSVVLISTTSAVLQIRPSDVIFDMQADYSTDSPL